MSARAADAAGMEIRPTPTDDEAAAIAAAVYVGWPRAAAPADDTEISTAWRFSGRWWRRPSWRRPTQRRRP